MSVHIAARYTYYDVLQLASNGDRTALSKDEIKAAYRRALLIHHPDKLPHHDLKSSSGLQQTSQSTSVARHSIDEIVAAYETLLDPEKRAAYDEAIKRNDKELGMHTGTHIGVEVFDLEDLVYDGASDTWYKSCRCGDDQGYVLTPADLEREAQHGEIYVGCRGCSLFVRVLFAIEDG